MDTRRIIRFISLVLIALSVGVGGALFVNFLQSRTVVEESSPLTNTPVRESFEILLPEDVVDTEEKRQEVISALEILSSTTLTGEQAPEKVINDQGSGHLVGEQWQPSEEDTITTDTLNALRGI